MGLFSVAKLFGVTIRESATDGSDFTNPDADYRRLFLGEDGNLHLKDSAGSVTDIGGGAGSVATDAIWDAAGDLAVGTGANTAAKLTLGAAGGAVSRVNGAVAWNSGTGFPTAATGDRYWRTDLRMEAFYDGTRWLSAQLYRMEFSPTVLAGITVDGEIAYSPAHGGVYDLWLEKAYYEVGIQATNTGGAYWTLEIYKSVTGGGGDALVTGSGANTSALAASQKHHLTATLDLLAGTSAVYFYAFGTKTGSPTGIKVAAAMTFRLVLT